MLDVWQRRFPEIFAKYPQILEAEVETNDALAEILNRLGSRGLINENTLPIVLKVWSSYCRDEFIVLLNKVLNDQSFKHIIEEIHYDVGLWRAISLFNLSDLNYETNRQDLVMLNTLFANPLCRVIYDARWRAFSDYAIVSESISQDVATCLIEALRGLEGEASFRLFFDTLAKFRQQPCTQKYLLEDGIDLTETLYNAFRIYCHSMSSESYLQTYQMLKQVQRDRHDPNLFNEIKHIAAADMEAKDFYSDRDYQSLMNEIGQVWQEINLDVFEEILKSSPQYIGVASAALNRSSSVAAKPVVSTGEDYISRCLTTPR